MAACFSLGGKEVTASVEDWLPEFTIPLLKGKLLHASSRVVLYRNRSLVLLSTHTFQVGTKIPDFYVKYIINYQLIETVSV
jgi:hypothetical protein